MKTDDRMPIATPTFVRVFSQDSHAPPAAGSQTQKAQAIADSLLLNFWLVGFMADLVMSAQSVPI